MPKEEITLMSYTYFNLIPSIEYRQGDRGIPQNRTLVAKSSNTVISNIENTI